MVTREGQKEMEKKTTIRNPDNSRVKNIFYYGEANLAIATNTAMQSKKTNVDVNDILKKKTQTKSP